MSIDKSTIGVYKVDGFWIAADDAKDAFDAYMEEAEALQDAIIDDLEPGESTSITIDIHRLTEEAINAKNNPCCNEEIYMSQPKYVCNHCLGKDDTVYISLRDMINERENFPAVLCWEI